MRILDLMSARDTINQTEDERKIVDLTLEGIRLMGRQEAIAERIACASRKVKELAYSGTIVDVTKIKQPLVVVIPDNKTPDHMSGSVNNESWVADDPANGDNAIHMTDFHEIIDRS